jgi:cytochrome c6
MTGRRADCLRFAALAALAAAAPAAPAADIFKGRELYAKHCELCHGPDGRGTLAGAPDFTRSAGLLRPDLDLVQYLRSGRGAHLAYQGILRNEQLLDVVAYLRTLQR